MVDLATVDKLLGAPPGHPSWRVAAIATRQRALATWLSSAQGRGMRLTPDELSYLDRTRRRVVELHRVGEEMAAAHGLRVIKGPRIAAYMPPGLLRHSGDADLVAPDERSLWACVLDLRARYGAVPQSISVLDAPGSRHVLVVLKWPAEQAHLDKPMGADIATYTFVGDFRVVPVRVAPPAEDDLAGLFCVAEERFQRRYRVKDLLDLLVLADALEQRLGDRLTATVCALADSLTLAPELGQLVAKADEWAGVSEAWQQTLVALRPLAREEKARRRPGRAGVHRLRNGMPLDSRPGPTDSITVHRRDGGDVARTPVGSCLLVRRPVITEESWEQATEYARGLSSASSAEEVNRCVTTVPPRSSA
jgi:hypothetical protein